MARKTSRARLPAADSLSNFAASLGAGKDKAANDSFFVADLPRDQIEAMYRGDWLARKVVDIVPYDCIREWRQWHGEPAAVAAVQRTERRLGLRGVVQRAMTLGRLYGGGAVIVGTDEEDAAGLARPLVPEAVGPDGIRFLHVVSRWQLGTLGSNSDPLDPFYGEPDAYTLAGATRGTIALHPSRVIRFLGNPLPDPALASAQLWSDSVLQSLYDAIHAVALTAAGTTSLVHEAKVDIVTVPGLTEHLSNAATTAQLSQRFAYAAAMKSINNLLLLGDGESWARQRIDFGGLPEMVRTFLQMAAGAADIPVTRLLGQSPAGLSATGDSDTRNYYDMIAARQELDLRPRLERLDALLLRSAGVAAEAVSFAFRPLWQLGAADKAAVALQKAQATAIYAGLGLWPAAVTAALVRGQLLEDGTYPGAAAALAEDPHGARPVADYSPDQPRDDGGRWTAGGGHLAARRLPVDYQHRFRVAGAPFAGSTPEEEDEKQEKQQRATPIVPLPGSANPTRENARQPVPIPMSAFGEAESIPHLIGPGPFARMALPAGPSRTPTSWQQRQINELGERFGCHTCGTKISGMEPGKFIGDHQPPRAMIQEDTVQIYLPHCAACSLRQGGLVRAWKARPRREP